MNYELDILIDGEALDQEWLNQASLYMRYSKHSATMTQRLDEAKQNLDICKAEADKRIRKEPGNYGIEKVTETVVANAILIEDGYKDAYDEFLSAKYEADMARAAVNAFEQRKSALENLVKLYGHQYFAGPTVPYLINREWEEKEKGKRQNSKIADSLNVSRRRG